METTKLSSKGQVIIPKPFRTAHHWEPGQELVVIDTGDGVLLKPKTPFQETKIDDVASCLLYVGKPKTLDDMEQAIKRGVKERFCDSG
jgi:AbrB family looped-hinge helix DNA binding protein